MHLMHRLNHFSRDFIRAVRSGKFDRQSDGGIILVGSARLHGVYREGIRGLPDSFRSHDNLIPDAGILSILNVYFGATAKISTWYIAPFSGATDPAANLTAANFSSTQAEITSGSEGYTESTRVQYTPAGAAAGKISNSAALSAFTIATASQLNINGAGLLSASAKGATSGVLASCAKYTATRVLNDADTWDAQYDITLAD